MASSWQPGDLVAENARTARQLARCALCPRAILPGRDRIADLPDGHGVVHVACASELAGQAGR